MTSIAFDLSTDGHRESYLRLCEKALGVRRLIGRRKLWTTLFPSHVVYLTMDDYFLAFAALAFLRGLCGRSSVGLSIRLEALLQERTWKRRLKRGILRVLIRCPGVRVLSLSPPWAVPGIETFSSSWIEDPQLWDLPYLDLAPGGLSPELQQTLQELRGNKKLIVALGRQDEQKGIRLLVEIAEDPTIRDRYAFLVVGPARQISADLLTRLRAAGGVWIDKYLPESELISLYDFADWVWCCYEPSYNVNSGIFGRAVQKKRPTLVRQGSYLESFQTHYGFGVALPYEKTAAIHRLLAMEAPRNAPASHVPEGLSRFRLLLAPTKELPSPPSE